MASASESPWITALAKTLILFLAAWAASYALDPWVQVSWWRCVCGIYAIRVLTRPWEDSR